MDNFPLIFQVSTKHKTALQSDLVQRLAEGWNFRSMIVQWYYNDPCETNVEKTFWHKKTFELCIFF